MPRVAVVGGGPAGLMAAEVLAVAGAQVTVFERMPSVGRKLQLAGRGGLNLTHSEPLGAFLDRYGEARGRLAAAIEAFGPEALRAWSAGLGQPTFVGTSGRVFPEGFRATALLRAWLARLDALGVERRVRHTWEGFGDEVVTGFRPDATVLALGGASWPRSGSDGRWAGALSTSGIAVAPLRPANGGFVVAWSPSFVERFEGQPLKDVLVRHGSASARGDVVVTRDGIEGGPVYAVSRSLRAAIDADGSAVVTVDLRPARTVDELEALLARRRPRDSTSNVLRRVGFAPVAAGLLRESGAELTAAALKGMPLAVVAAQPIDRAISSAGGVALDEVDDSFMLVRRPGTFVAGEMLDWEAPTGGYLLQACFSTGVAAAEGARRWIASKQGVAG